MKFRLDRKGVREILLTQCGPAVNAAAAQAAARAKAAVDDDVPVETSPYTTDRRAASVTIAHPTGMLLQASDGVLTRAAAAVGLEVKAK